MPNAGKTVNRLSSVESHRLNRWLEDNHPSFAPGITREEVRAGAMAALKFDMTIYNIDGALRACELTLPPALERVPRDKQILALAKAIKELAKDSADLMFIEQIYKTLREAGL